MIGFYLECKNNWWLGWFSTFKRWSSTWGWTTFHQNPPWSCENYCWYNVLFLILFFFQLLLFSIIYTCRSSTITVTEVQVWLYTGAVHWTPHNLFDKNFKLFRNIPSSDVFQNCQLAVLQINRIFNLWPSIKPCLHVIFRLRPCNKKFLNYPLLYPFHKPWPPLKAPVKTSRL